MSLQKLPNVSVIMPIRNEASFIKHSLTAALAQDYPAHLMEVIVVDGMSDDGTRDIVRGLQTSNQNLRLIDNPAKIVPTAMNLGIKHARGDVIVRVDGHTLIAPDYIKECVAALERSKASNVGGPMTAVAEGRFGRAAACATSSPFGVGGARFHYSKCEEWVDTVYLGAWPRDVFSRVGLFDEEQVRNQDDEFNYRLLSQGGKILLSPRIKSSYYNRTTIRSLWRQYFQYGYWKVRVMQKHPRQMRLRQFIPPLFVFVFVSTAVMIPISPMFIWIVSGVVISYLFATVLASILTRSEWRSMIVLPVVFATLHFAYGSGFLVGVLKFWNRWNENKNTLFKYLKAERRSTVAVEPLAVTALVSVVMPVFNGQSFVAEAIESIRAQTFSHWELIICDDGSSDRSLEICRSFETSDSRIKTVQNDRNLGLSSTMNRLLSLARGKYVAIQEQDDISLPHRFAREVDLLEARPDVDVVSGVSAWMNDRDQVFAYFPGSLQSGAQYKQNTWEMVSYLYTEQCKVVNAACMFRREIIDEDDQPFDEHAKMSIDWQFFLHVAHQHRILGIPEVLVHMRRGHAHKSLTTQKELQFKEARRCIDVIYRRYRNDRNSPINYWLYRQAMATQKILEGRYWGGLRGWLTLAQAIAYNPFNQKAWSSWFEISFRALRKAARRQEYLNEPKQV